MSADIEQLISEMTLEEKISLCEGASSWSTTALTYRRIPAIYMSDGPHGLRKEKPASERTLSSESEAATCFPAAVTSGCSWDESIIERIGAAIGEEASASHIALVLGPGANIKRNPLCGRNFEYFSEDPFLTGKLAAAYIRGCEGVNTGTTLKHFACNNQERARMKSNSVISQRALREIYLTGFEIAVSEGKPSAMMCSYNKVNGTYSSDNKHLLKNILRGEWGFDGVIMTDWGAMNNRIKAFSAGCDLTMPGGSKYMFKACRKAVKDGTLPEEDINECVRRILNLAFKYNDIPPIPGVLTDHNDFAAHAACESAVLLKNEDNILPLKKKQNVVLIGAMAKNMRYQGSGSSRVTPSRVTNPVDAMPDLTWSQGCLDDGSTNELLIENAVSAARFADVAVIFAGLPERYESEGFDRENMKMPSGHLRLINEVQNVNPNTVVVLMCGSPVECPWADHVKGILYMGLPGQAGGEAARRILYGDVNPSGRLTESWPYKYADCISSSYYAKKDDALYMEDIYVGYRYYDKAGVPVRWPFGYGLSYSTFEYSEFNFRQDIVSVVVTNTGSTPGADVVQLYIAPPQDGIHRPVKELKGFKKVFLEAGESRTVSFPIDGRSFAIWQNDWKVPTGNYTFMVGDLRESIYIEGTEIDIPSWQRGSWVETMAGIPDTELLENLTKRKYEPEDPGSGKFTMNSSLSEMKDSSFIMKRLYNFVCSYIKKHSNGKNDPDDPQYRMTLESGINAPLRALQMFTASRDGLFRGLLAIANGHLFKGLKKMMKN